MKLALRWIPTEVWVDVFVYPWITRKRLGQIVGRFKNRKFVEILQYCLHERGKRTLSCLYLDKTRLTLIPRTPMPENIKLFRQIEIRHFDLSALDFLRHASTLFTSVNLNFFGFGSENDSPKLRTLLGHLAPLIHGIHSLEVNQAAIPLMEQYFAPKLAQAKMLSIRVDVSTLPQPAINFCMNWLTSEEHPGPRLLKIFTESENFQQISMAVQQQFLSAKRPCTFAIRLIHYDYGHINPIAGFHLDNNLGEQLHGEYKHPWLFQIVRHQPNAGKALQEWVEETNEERSKSSVIELCGDLTIGQIAANAGTNEANNAGGEEEHQPSTSG